MGVATPNRDRPQIGTDPKSGPTPKRDRFGRRPQNVTKVGAAKSDNFDPAPQKVITFRSRAPKKIDPAYYFDKIESYSHKNLYVFFIYFELSDTIANNFQKLPPQSYQN